MNKILLIISVLLLSITVKAQQDSTKIVQPNEERLILLDVSTMRAIAKESPKKNTLFFTFGIWCEPCRLHLPGAIAFAKEHDLEFFVLLVDPMDSDETKGAYYHIKGIDKNVKVAVLFDEAYQGKTRKRNKQLVKEITPPQFEAIDDYSKYILLNKQGEVIMVTNWKDNRDNDWRDDSKMVQQRIAPLLK